MELEVERFSDIGAFRAGVWEFLAAREAEHNLPLAVCSLLEAGRSYTDIEPWLGAVKVEGRVVLASLRTPPYDQILSLTDVPDAVDPMADAVAESSPGLPAVVGPTEVVGRFATRFADRTGRPAELGLRQRIFKLESVISPRPCAGSWRMADSDDRELLIRWQTDFQAEALPHSPVDAPVVVDRWLAGERTIHLWETDGEPVAMVGVGGPTPNGIRVGPVYTPRDLRGHGYASNLTAAASAAQLNSGRRFVFLFTDLSNPTSNKIYQDIGYRPVSDVDEYRFVA